jgi:hypothetical protein
MEASEDLCQDKARTLIKKFSSLFFKVTFTVHPKDIPGEARGKSSNVSWAAREMAQEIPLDGRVHVLYSVIDADTCLTQDYFSCVNYHYCTIPSSERLFTMYAPVTIFDR